MAQPRIPDASVKIAEFAKIELDRLVEAVSTFDPDLKVGDGALMSALILAARRSPIESVSAVLSTYWKREAQAAAVNAVCGFLRAHADA